MKATILTVGDELLIGQVINSNAAWLGEQLGLLGVEVERMVTVGDEESVIQAELARAFERPGFVLVTGGLGPTHDDLTRDALAGYFGVSLRIDEDVLARILDRFERRGRTMPERNRVQALVPEGFTVLPNPVGTAPGLWMAKGAGPDARLLAVLPGVPYEMKRLFQDEVVPRLQHNGDLRVIGHRTLRTAGIGESNLQEMIGDVAPLLDATRHLAYLPSTGGLRLRLTAIGDGPDEVAARLDELESFLRGQVGRYIYAVGEVSIEEAVGRVLRESGRTLAVAESCTGGHVADRITNISGSSAYMLGGLVVYGNTSKVEILGVNEADLAAHGAVSEPVALQMAHGVRRRFSADIGIATTGIAGPTGGTPEKPVGTVWIAYATKDTDRAVLLRLVDDRILNKELTGTAVLDLVRRMVNREA